MINYLSIDLEGTPNYNNIIFAVEGFIKSVNSNYKLFTNRLFWRRRIASRTVCDCLILYLNTAIMWKYKNFLKWVKSKSKWYIGFRFFKIIIGHSLNHGENRHIGSSDISVALGLVDFNIRWTPIGTHILGRSVFYFGKEIEKRHFNSCVKFLEKKWLKIISVRHGFNFTRTYQNGYLIKGDVERRNRGGLEV